MARTLNKLTELKCRSIKKPGMHSDGGGLYLSAKASGAKSWSFIWKVKGRRREMGLGPYPAVGLADARRHSVKVREAVAAGRDPIGERKKDAEPSFGECADQFLATMESQWRNEKHRGQWRMTLSTYAASIRDKNVAEVSTEDVLAVLTPLWTTKPETASRLRGRIERVLNYAKTKGWRSGENPALWRGHLQNVLPARQKLTRGHHAAMPYAELPEFMMRLSELTGFSAAGLRFIILTAARSGEVREAVWSEIDFDRGIWTIPAERMKAGREHRVPLSSEASTILANMLEVRISDYVFPGQRPLRPLSVMAFEMLLRRLDVAHFTVHGFRSAFRDWAGDASTFPREVAEAALAHTVGDMTERAYRRSDALEKRRQLMEAWAQFCVSGSFRNG